MPRRLLFIAAGCISLSMLPAAEPPLEQLLQTARAADARGAPAEALVALEQADLLRPNDPAILQQLARQCSDHSEDVTGRTEKLKWCLRARDYARRAVALQPDGPENLLSIAIALGKLARLSDIRTRIDYARLVHDYAIRAVALAPDYDYAHHVLGQWHVEVASVPAAQRWFARVVYGELPPASAQDAILHFRRAVALAPEVPAHHAALGLVLQTEGQLDAARMSFERAVALPPRDHYDRQMQQRAQTALLR